jgi:hypothetical protein
MNKLLLTTFCAINELIINTLMNTEKYAILAKYA